jgi:hypothetical protein
MKLKPRNLRLPNTITNRLPAIGEYNRKLSGRVRCAKP